MQATPPEMQRLDEYKASLVDPRDDRRLIKLKKQLDEYRSKFDDVKDRLQKAKQLMQSAKDSLRDIRSELTLAQDQLERAKASYTYASFRLRPLGKVNQGQLRQLEQAFKRSSNRLMLTEVSEQQCLETQLRATVSYSDLEKEFVQVKNAIVRLELKLQQREKQLIENNHLAEIKLAILAGVPEMYHHHLKVVKKTNHVDIYFGGDSRPDGPHHAHYRIERCGNTYRRDPYYTAAA